MKPRFVRLGETNRSKVNFSVDGVAVQGLEGDTLLTAVLTCRGSLRSSEFGGEMRAGFCLMASCQDCWLWFEDGKRVRACDALLQPGMQVLTYEPDAHD